MAKSKHSEDYSKAFKEIKKHLPIMYIDAEGAGAALKQLPRFYLFLEYNEFGVYPRFLAKGKDTSVDLSDYFSLIKKDNSIAIGFKRSDDLLDIKGKRFSKSKNVQKTLEFIKCDRSWIKWGLYKLKLILSKE